MEREDRPRASINVWLLGMASFLNDLSSEMIMPILPLFIKALGGGGIAVGLIGGLRDSISSILKVICGYLSDRKGKRKIFVIWGYFVSVFFKLLLSFSKTWHHILIFSGLERVGKGLRTAPRDAIIADSIPQARGRGFGLHRSLDTLGAILGCIVALIFYWVFGFSFASIIFIAAIIAFPCLIPLYSVREEKRKPQDATLKVSLRKLPKSLKFFIIVASVFALAQFSYMFFILKAEAVFMPLIPLKDSRALVIILYILFNLFYALLSIPFGALSDRIGRRRVLGFGYFLFSLICLGFAFLESLATFIVLFALYGMVYAIVDGNQRALVCDLSLQNLTATSLGTFHTIIGIIALLANIIAGGLWQFVSVSATFVYGGLTSLIAFVLFIIFGNYFKSSKGTLFT
jgi:MFS family permease